MGKISVFFIINLESKQEVYNSYGEATQIIENETTQWEKKVLTANGMPYSF